MKLSLYEFERAYDLAIGSNHLFPVFCGFALVLWLAFLVFVLSFMPFCLLLLCILLLLLVVALSLPCCVMLLCCFVLCFVLRLWSAAYFAVYALLFSREREGGSRTRLVAKARLKMCEPCPPTTPPPLLSTSKRLLSNFSNQDTEEMEGCNQDIFKSSS